MSVSLPPSWIFFPFPCTLAAGEVGERTVLFSEEPCVLAEGDSEASPYHVLGVSVAGLCLGGSAESTVL